MSDNPNLTFITSTLLLSEFFTPPPFDPEEVISTHQDNGNQNLDSVAYVVSRAPKIISKAVATGTITLRTRTGPITLEKTESKMTTLGGFFQLALTEYRAEGIGKKVLVMRKYGFTRTALPNESNEWKVVYLTDEHIAELVVLQEARK
jgi:hypothetical protein